MKKDDFCFAGLLLKPTGNKGEVILKFNKDLSKEILKLESILIEVDGKLVPFFIESIKTKSTKTVVAKLDGVDSEDDTNEFIDSNFFIAPENQQVIDLNLDNYYDVVGYVVKDENEELIGSVVDFIDVVNNPLLNVKTKSGEILIPANDDLIIEIDDDDKIIIMHIPQGLLDLS